jgi:hypothetical protein
MIFTLLSTEMRIFPQKCVYSLAGSVPLLSHLTSCIPTKSYPRFDSSFAIVKLDLAQAGIQTSYIPNTILMSNFGSLYRRFKESDKARGLLWHFVLRLFLWCGGVSPTSNPHTQGSPSVGYPRLLMQLFAADLHSWKPFFPTAFRGRDIPWWKEAHLKRKTFSFLQKKLLD